MKKLTRVLTIFLAIFMINTALPVFTSALTTDDGFVYEILEEEVTIVDYTGDNTEVIIPTEIGGYPVKSIGDNAFFATQITAVDIPNSVKYIGNYVFNYSNITSITIPESVLSIGEQSIARCSKLTTINIEDGIEIIGEMAFAYCPLVTSISIPDSVTNIGGGAFAECTSLASITIPDTVTDIGAYIFEGCSNLETVILPQTMTSIGYSTFAGCSSLTSITIPNSVTEIGVSAFSGCKDLVSITIPNRVNRICERAFYNCNQLTSVTMPKSVTHIGEEAFYNCDNLLDIYYGGTQVQWNAIDIGSGNQSLRYADIHFQSYADYEGITDDGYKYAVVDEKVEIKDYIGYDTKLSVPSAIDGYPVTAIGYQAFAGCDSTHIIIPNSVTSIGELAFGSCNNLVSIDVNSDNECYASEFGVLFNKDKTLLIQYPIGAEDAHYYISGGVTSIGDYAFYNCQNIKSITIPDIITNIGESAFVYCDNLTAIYYSGTEEQWSHIAISDYNDSLLNATVYFNKTGPSVVQPTNPLPDPPSTGDNDATQTKPVVPGVLGDVDGDGAVTIMDATAIQLHIAQLEIIPEDKLACADTDGDGSVTIMDATQIQLFIAQLIPSL